ncbi:hypothetical protein [Paraburkholderia phytofirmans]|uniref:hypothetical protein n=1 Tax=Paraburkholderia phytofirmans TaxID=261302 RepID=UPI0038BBEEDD
MILDIKFPAPRRVNTQATLALEASRETETFHARLRLRPPIGVYNLSLATVIGHFDRCIDEIGELPPMNDRSTQASAKRNEFLATLDGLLDALMEHIDDCNSVLKCFFKDEKSTEYKEIYNAFKSEIRPYRDRVGKIVNKIKHEQGRLRLVHSDSVLGTSFGYYVEGVDLNGVIGPDPDIHHPRGETAYSLGRDFRLHVNGIFFVAARLAHAIYRATGKGVVTSLPENASLANLVKRVGDIPPIFFPDEISQPFPTVKITDTICRVSVGFGNFEKAKSPPGAKISVSFVGDGVSRSFRIPYIGKNN